jgi:hydrogenase nickel incorporation protein HypA/HybF
MHELSIARAIVEVAERHAGGHCVTRVEVRVGHLRQVVPGSLRFAFEIAVRGTALDGAELAITHVPVTVRCRACAAESVVGELPFSCARCAEPDVEVIAGEELLVEALELHEGPPPGEAPAAARAPTIQRPTSIGSM